ncbi:hypothetical protein [Promicromonospora kroppenstedtii]|uniref:hypothetical protein n=1 Tax=Promicromonospora kroppenstedtii TaxID=440482 RepID=UPI0004B2C862|nr:hypothetical protein [Promicromonospora kroppenstedtii]
MSNTSHQIKAGRSRLAAVGLGASLLLGAGAMTASAAPVTEPVNWASNSGTTASGVSWTGRGGVAGTNGNVRDDVTRTLTFSEPVTATFDVHNLNGWDGASRECVQLSSDVVLVRLDPDNTWNPNTRQLCFRGPQGSSADGNTNGNTISSFRTSQPVTQLALTGTSGGNRQSTIRDLYVTSDEAPPVPMVAPAFGLAGLLATGALAGVRRVRSAKRENVTTTQA